MSRRIDEKAARFVREGRAVIEEVKENRRSFNVTGDSDTYRVVIDLGGAFCTCRANFEGCSHILASRLFVANGQ